MRCVSEAIALHGVPAGARRRDRGRRLRSLVRLEAGDDARRVLPARRPRRFGARSCSTCARRSSSPPTSCRSSAGGSRACARPRAVLRDAGVLIRPHPQNVEPWQHAELHDLANVAVWPRAGGNPVDAATRADYFDSIHHSAAVVGVNTSAQIESAIVGRGVHTLLVPGVRGHAGRHAALPPSPAGQRRPAARDLGFRGARARPRGGGARPGGISFAGPTLSSMDSFAPSA